MGVISWLIFGLIVGVLAKIIMPGRDPGGLIFTVVLGVVGAMLGGWIGIQIGWGTVDEFNIRSMGLAVAGGIILLAGYRVAKG